MKKSITLTRTKGQRSSKVKAYRPRAAHKLKDLQQPIPRHLTREYRFILYITEAQAEELRAKFPGLKLSRAYKKEVKE